MLQRQNSVPTTELFRKTGGVTRRKLSLQHVPLHVPATILCPSVCRPLVYTKPLDSEHQIVPIF